MKQSESFGPRAGALLLAIFAASSGVNAGTVYIPNASFESPETTFAYPQVNLWQKTPKPGWFVETPEQQWEQTIGVFLNRPVEEATHIDNIEGNQAVFLFALPTAGLFQDYNSIGGTNTVPAHDFAATFEPGKAYHLNVGVLGGGGGMTNGATLELSLYYRDANSNIVTVAAATVTNTAATFPTNTHLTDYTVSIPAVRTSDPWVGKHIGVQILSTIGFDKIGGYWDLDNVRLTDEIPVPNGSFESPETTFAYPQVNSWQKAPKPFWFQETPEAQWDQTIGVFLNRPIQEAAHIDNVESNQAVFLFALPGAALFQDYTTVGGTNTTPSQEFGALYREGRSYKLTVGVLGGGGGMTNGATLELSLYYRDAASNIITVAATTVTNSAAAFPTNTHLTDFAVTTPPVKSGDAWAGKNIGIQLLSNNGFDQIGGYWDLDNVRLAEIKNPALKAVALDANQIQLNLQSEPGLTFEVLGTESLPASSWISLTIMTNVTGNQSITLAAPGSGQRFYQARQLP